MISDAPLANEIYKLDDSNAFRKNPEYKWSYKIQGDDYVIDPKQKDNEHDIYVIFDSPKDDAAVQGNFKTEYLKDACLWGNGGREEHDIATRVCKNVNDEMFQNEVRCICHYGQTPDGFKFIWENTRGTYSYGGCCCRALGMIKVLNELGIGPYKQDFVNENPEPNYNRERPPNRYCSICEHVIRRQGWGGGIPNNWQGVCKKEDGGICYSPQGYHISAYETMNDAPEWPKTQGFDHVHAFEYYCWILNEYIPTTICPHQN